MFWALPEIRRGWWAVAALVNPTLVMAPIIGQLPFLWAVAFFFAAIGCWRRDRRVAAVVLLVARPGHPPGHPHADRLPRGGGVVLVGAAASGPSLVGYGIAVLASLPFAYLVFDSPVMEDTSLGVKIGNFAATLAVRLFVVAAPLVLAALKHTGGRWLPRRARAPGRRAVRPRRRRHRHHPQRRLPAAVRADVGVGRPGPPPRPHAVGLSPARPTSCPALTYRVLRAGDGKVGMYQLLKAGRPARLRVLPREHRAPQLPRARAAYSAFLRKRQVDTVIIFANYDTRWRTNEHALLDQLADRRRVHRPRRSASTRSSTLERFDVYHIERTC